MSEMREEIWKIIISVLGAVATIGGFLYWHFKTVNGFKDEIHRIDLKAKELEHNDKMRENEIKRISDQLASVYNK